MNNFLNQNGKMLEEKLVVSDSAAVKISLRGLYNFKMTLPLLQVLEKPLAIPLSLFYMQQRVLGMAQ